MSSHACEDDLEVTRWTVDCEVMHSLPDGNGRDSNAMCLISTASLGVFIRRFSSSRELLRFV